MYVQIQRRKKNVLRKYGTVRYITLLMIYNIVYNTKVLTIVSNEYMRHLETVQNGRAKIKENTHIQKAFTREIRYLSGVMISGSH